MERIKERTRKSQSLGTKIGSINLKMMAMMAKAVMAKMARIKRKGESHVSPRCHMMKNKNKMGIDNRVLTSST